MRTTAAGIQGPRAGGKRPMVQICSNWSRDGWKGDSGLKGASPRPESTSTGLETGIIEARIGDPGAEYGEYHHDRERGLGAGDVGHCGWE